MTKIFFFLILFYFACSSSRNNTNSNFLLSCQDCLYCDSISLLINDTMIHKIAAKHDSFSFSKTNIGGIEVDSVLQCNFSNEEIKNIESMICKFAKESGRTDTSYKIKLNYSFLEFNRQYIVGKKDSAEYLFVFHIMDTRTHTPKFNLNKLISAFFTGEGVYQNFIIINLNSGRIIYAKFGNVPD